MAPKSQQYFTFKWHDPEIRISSQLTWNRRPRGLQSSPTIFDEALHEDLSEYLAQKPGISLLQYVDDLLIAAIDRETCLTGTEQLLRILGELRYILKEGQQWLSDAWKETVLKIRTPTTARQGREL